MPPLRDSWSGSRITRGSTRGALTMAMPVPRPNASLPVSEMMKFRLLLTDLGEGVGRVEPDRGQQRAHFALEILLDPGALRLVAVGVAHQVHAFFLQLRQHFAVQDRHTGADQAAGIRR